MSASISAPKRSKVSRLWTSLGAFGFSVAANGIAAGAADAPPPMASVAAATTVFVTGEDDIKATGDASAGALALAAPGTGLRAYRRDHPRSGSGVLPRPSGTTLYVKRTRTYFVFCSSGLSGGQFKTSFGAVCDTS